MRRSDLTNDPTTTSESASPSSVLLMTKLCGKRSDDGLPVAVVT